MEDDKFIINLRLRNSRYPLKVKRQEEDLYRTAADKANDLLHNISLKFSDIKEKDLLCMAILQLAYECEVLKKAYE